MTDRELHLGAQRFLDAVFGRSRTADITEYGMTWGEPGHPHVASEYAAMLDKAADIVTGLVFAGYADALWTEYAKRLRINAATMREAHTLSRADWIYHRGMAKTWIRSTAEYCDRVARHAEMRVFA